MSGFVYNLKASINYVQASLNALNVNAEPVLRLIVTLLLSWSSTWTLKVSISFYSLSSNLRGKENFHFVSDNWAARSISPATTYIYFIMSMGWPETLNYLTLLLEACSNTGLNSRVTKFISWNSRGLLLLVRCFELWSTPSFSWACFWSSIEASKNFLHVFSNYFLEMVSPLIHGCPRMSIICALVVGLNASVLSIRLLKSSVI